MCMRQITERTIAYCTLENVECVNCGKFKGNKIRENKMSLFDIGATLIFD